MTRGGAALILMMMEAVETATMLTSKARLGGKAGLSPIVSEMNALTSIKHATRRNRQRKEIS